MHSSMDPLGIRNLHDSILLHGYSCVPFSQRYMVLHPPLPLIYFLCCPLDYVLCTEITSSFFLFVFGCTPCVVSACSSICGCGTGVWSRWETWSITHPAPSLSAISTLWVGSLSSALALRVPQASRSSSRMGITGVSSCSSITDLFCLTIPTKRCVVKHGGWDLVCLFLCDKKRVRIPLNSCICGLPTFFNPILPAIRQTLLQSRNSFSNTICYHRSVLPSPPPYFSLSLSLNASPCIVGVCVPPYSASLRRDGFTPVPLWAGALLHRCQGPRLTDLALLHRHWTLRREYPHFPDSMLMALRLWACDEEEMSTSVHLRYLEGRPISASNERRMWSLLVKVCG